MKRSEMPMIRVRSVMATVGVLCLFAFACGDSERSARRSPAKGGTSGAGGRGGSTGGGTSGDGGSGGGSVPADWIEVCARWGESRCRRMEECIPYLHSVLGDCAAQAAQSCEDNSLYADLPFTLAEYERCLEATNQLSCDDAFYNFVIPPECIFNGSRPSGSPCDNGYQCDNGWCSTLAECGECESYAELGEPCLLDYCGWGLWCGATLLCEPPRYIGDRCGEAELCVGGLVCEDGVCARPPVAGEPCSTLEQRCDVYANAYCNLETLECESWPTAGPGEPCTDTGVICLGGSYCKQSAEPPTCEPYLPEDEPCNGTDLLCELACIDGVCARLNPERCE